MHRALHTTRIVVVNSLVYGVDNSCMLDALRQFGHRARGIALIDDTISDATLDTLEAVGQIDDWTPAQSATALGTRVKFAPKNICRKPGEALRILNCIPRERGSMRVRVAANNGFRNARPSLLLPVFH